jgi:hypothetical protein
LYAVDQVQSSITGYECGEVCVTALKGQLTDMVHRARQIDSQPGCTAVDQVAWTFGKEPGWCLPPEVEVIPYPGGSNQPGVIFVRVTRTSTPAPSGDPREQYFLDIATQGTNGQTQGELYNKVRIAMPLLEPGASMVIPIPLGPLGHDNTKDVYMPQAGTDGFANFKSLFYKGTSTITASEYCYVAENNTFVPCTQGGTDTFTTVNPLDPSEQWP